MIDFIRRLAWRLRGAKRGARVRLHRVSLGRGTVVEDDCRLIGAPRFLAGRNVYFNAGCHMLGDITIGDGVMFGPRVVVWGRDHGIAPGVPIREQAHVSAPIVIEANAWIAANVTILKGVRVGEGAVVGAGSVVTRDVPPNAIVVGVPARIVRYRVAQLDE